MKKTQIKVNAVATEYDNDGNLWITFKVPMEDRAKARGIERVMSEENRTYCAEIGEYRKKRSNSANSYAWALIGKLAYTIGIPKDEVYQSLVQELGINHHLLIMPKEEYPRFKRDWQARGLGWDAKLTGTEYSNGQVEVFAYFGTSAFDNRMMSHFIDLIVQECRMQDIETLPPDKLESMLERWDVPND